MFSLLIHIVFFITEVNSSKSILWFNLNKKKKKKQRKEDLKVVKREAFKCCKIITVAIFWIKALTVLQQK